MERGHRVRHGDGQAEVPEDPGHDVGIGQEHQDHHEHRSRLRRQLCRHRGEVRRAARRRGVRRTQGRRRAAERLPADSGLPGRTEFAAHSGRGAPELPDRGPRRSAPRAGRSPRSRHRKACRRGHSRLAATAAYPRVGLLSGLVRPGSACYTRRDQERHPKTEWRCAQRSSCSRPDVDPRTSPNACPGRNVLRLPACG